MTISICFAIPIGIFIEMDIDMKFISMSIRAENAASTHVVNFLEGDSGIFSPVN